MENEVKNNEETQTKIDSENLEIVFNSAHKKLILNERYILNERFKDGFFCPFCKKKHIVRYGHIQKGKIQRFKCLDCKKQFVTTSNTILYRTRKDYSVWLKYVDCMLNGLSIRKSAKICGLCINTAFVWRHKILDVLENEQDKVKLKGIIETQELFFDISYKGKKEKKDDNKKEEIVVQKPKKRGRPPKKKDQPKVDETEPETEQVCVPCAVNRHGNAISKITNLGKLSTKNLENLLSKKIYKKSTIISQNNYIYNNFSKRNKINFIKLRKGKTKKMIYNINTINNYHFDLELFIYFNFCGVATKYLNNYLTWFNLMMFNKVSPYEQRRTLINSLINTPISLKFKLIDKRPEIPLPIYNKP